MATPDKLNGYPVLHSESEADGSAVILAFRDGHKPHPFVVARWHPSLGDSWHQGDYCATLPEAMDALRIRAGRMAGAA